MGMDIWGMYNGCVMESKEFVYPILRIDYDSINNNEKGKKFNNVKIIRDISLILSGQDIKNSVYVREKEYNSLRVGDFEWLNVRGFKNVRVEVIELVPVTYEVSLFNDVDDHLWKAVTYYHDKALLHCIGLFNDLYYSERTEVLNFTNLFDVNDRSLSWWNDGNADYVLDNILFDLEQHDIDYFLNSVNDFRKHDELRDGSYARFFDALCDDVVRNRKRYVIDAS